MASFWVSGLSQVWIKAQERFVGAAHPVVSGGAEGTPAEFVLLNQSLACRLKF
jgi:hypothetical protein